MRKSIAVCGILCACAGPLAARDINLDAVYLTATSPRYARLLDDKVEAYRSAGAYCVAGDVAFAQWLDGYTIAFVREVQGVNILLTYNRRTRRTEECYRCDGTVTGFRAGASGRYVYLKRMTAASGVTKGETIAFDITRKKAAALPSGYLFIDFSVVPGTDAILMQGDEGLIEYHPETGRRSLVVKKNEYSSIEQAGGIVVGYTSPNRQKMLLVGGSGGSYRALLRTADGVRPLPRVTSATEIAWLDNDRIVFRSGSTGGYAVTIYRVSDGKSRDFVTHSLNTNITFSLYPKLLTCLNNQLITIYDVRKDTWMETGLEGEDVAFTPDGTWCSAIFLKQLFIMNINTVAKKRLEIAVVGRRIHDTYRQLLESRRDHRNTYSAWYIKRKIESYRAFIE